MLRLVVISLFLEAYYQADIGRRFSKSEYWKRNILVENIDRDILERRKRLLNNGASWHKNTEITCSDKNRFTLFCALEKASIDVNGVYRHRQAVRFVIDDLYKSYWSDHRLIDFNNNPKTVYSDINRVMLLATQRVNGKLEE